MKFTEFDAEEELDPLWRGRWQPMCTVGKSAGSASYFADWKPAWLLGDSVDDFGVRGRQLFLCEGLLQRWDVFSGN